MIGFGAAVERRAAWLLAAASLTLCLVFAAAYPTEWDSVQLVLGLDRFDVTEDSPHPPGYWLYVFSGRVLRLLTPLSGPAAMRLLAAVATAATVGITATAGGLLGDRWLKVSVGAFLVTSPFMLFYGATVATYPFDALTCALLVLLALRARPGSWHPAVAGGVLGLGSGFRPTALFVLGPLLAYIALRSVRTLRMAVVTVATLAAGIALWAVPMIVEQPGGWSRYRSYSEDYLDSAMSMTSVLSGAPRTGVVNNLGEATGYTLAAIAVLLPALLAGAVLLAVRRRDASAAPRHAPAALWLAFGVPFVFVVAVHFGKDGYVLSYLPALALLMLLAGASAASRGRLVLAGLVIAGALVQFQRFTSAPGVLPVRFLNRQELWFTQDRHGAPYRLTRPQLEQVDRETRQYLALGRTFDPRRDVLVYVSVDGGYRLRHAAWTMPEFTAHYVLPGRDHFRVRHNRRRPEADGVVEVPPRGTAVFVLDAAFPEVQRLVATGAVREERLSTGPSVWVARSGVRLFGVQVVESPDATRFP